VFLALTFVWFVFARAEYVGAIRWVEHTNEVKLAIANARIASDEGDLVRAAEWIEDVRALTADNPRQQSRLAGLHVDARDAGAQLAGLMTEEDVLLHLRAADEERKSTLVWVALGVSATFALGLAATSFVLVKRNQHLLAQETSLLGSLIESIGDSVVAIDHERRYVAANGTFRRIFPDGFAQGELAVASSQRQDARKEDGTPLEVDEGPLRRALAGENVDGVVMSVASGGSTRVWLSATGRPVLDEGGAVIAAVAVLRDVTRERADRAKIERQAEELRVQSLVDDLTGLYNRRGFLLLAEQHARAATRAKRPFAIAFADLDGLKAINDGLGHDEGDRAIRRMAAVLKATVRDADIVARLGGDEFVLLLDGADEASFARVTERLHHEMSVDATREAPRRPLSVSVGAAFRDAADPQTVEQLMAIADDRMYAQKRASRPRA
jgi:diguanylate cyclase (GGDEF)-like protein